MPGRPKDDAPQAHERVQVAEDGTPQSVERRAARAMGYTTGSSGAGPYKAKAGQKRAGAWLYAASRRLIP